jgi:hypothetical protein
MNSLNQLMKPTAPLRNTFRVFATTPFRGLSLSRWAAREAVVTSEPMLKKNRSAPNSAVIPVLYYPDVRDAVEWLTTALPFTERLRIGDHWCQLVHSNGAIVVVKPSGHANAAPSTVQSSAAHSVSFVSRGSTHSFDAPRQPVLVFSLNPRITCMANGNARSSTHGDISGRFRRPFSIPTPADWGGELLVE